MDVQTPATRKHDPDSSHEAEEVVTASGRRAAQQRQAAEAVRAHPGVTSAELARRSGLDRYMLGRRLPECETAGTVVRGSQVRDPQTGRTGVSWWPAEYREEDYRRDCLVEDAAERIIHTGSREERRAMLARYRQSHGAELGERIRARVEELWPRRREVA
ncbi:hypothetical protein [Halorhodospira sp. 9622]|uniref:hypothetical protein n=1 Tax=Halorhodospira sp. 9622 TaxID=2899136 RepID=UPI001EE8BD4C|nr:hypothetical protein [Halorhodospira sp. 9622]MCG5538973.1 hypothetical protein [Halorhodospira sp. 9622]